MIRQEHLKKGTAVSNKYQTEESGTNQPAVLDTVSVAVAELGRELREGLQRRSNAGGDGPAAR